MGKSCADIRVQPTKKPLAKGVNEYFFHPLVTQVIRAETIPMADEKRFSMYFALNGASVNGDPEFLFEITEHPQIMIANECKDRNAGIAQGGQFAQEAGESFGDNRLVFEPKFKQVPDEVDRFCLRCNGVQPTADLTFTFRAAQAGIGAKMKVRNEVGFFACCVHGAKVWNEDYEDFADLHGFFKKGIFRVTLPVRGIQVPFVPCRPKSPFYRS